MRVGVLAVGSHAERHGTVLPPDADARIAEHIAREAVERTGAEFLGVLKKSYELLGIDTGDHQSLDELADELRGELEKAKESGVQAVVLVNGHGGNLDLGARIDALQRETGVRVKFNSRIIELEVAHAGTEEVSIGAAIGIADESRLEEHVDAEHHPEVGFVGLKEARKRYPWAEEHAQGVMKDGVKVDKELGAELVEQAIVDAVKDIEGLAAL